MKYFYIAAIFLLQGCTSTIPVQSLESTIRDAVMVAKSATPEGKGDLTIVLNVTNGFKAGGTLPIPVVPLGISKTSSTSTTLTLKIDLEEVKINDLAGAKSIQSEIFILDTKTGLLSTPKL